MHQVCYPDAPANTFVPYPFVSGEVEVKTENNRISPWYSAHANMLAVLNVCPHAASNTYSANFASTASYLQ